VFLPGLKKTKLKKLGFRFLGFKGFLKGFSSFSV